MSWPRSLAGRHLPADFAFLITALEKAKVVTIRDHLIRLMLFQNAASRVYRARRNFRCDGPEQHPRASPQVGVGVEHRTMPRKSR